MSSTTAVPTGRPKVLDEAPGLAGARLVYVGRTIEGRAGRLPVRIVVSYRPAHPWRPYAVHYLVDGRGSDRRDGPDFWLHQGSYLATEDDAVAEVSRRQGAGFNIFAERRPNPTPVVRGLVRQNASRVQEFADLD